MFQEFTERIFHRSKAAFMLWIRSQEEKNVRFKCMMYGCQVSEQKQFKLQDILKEHLKKEHNLEYETKEAFLS